MILGSRNVETVQFLTDRPDNNASNSSILSVVSFRKPLILSKSVYVQDLFPNEYDATFPLASDRIASSNFSSKL